MPVVMILRRVCAWCVVLFLGLAILPLPLSFFTFMPLCVWGGGGPGLVVVPSFLFFFFACVGYCHPPRTLLCSALPCFSSLL
ncbi:hypothetical protein DFH27DRAFT_582449 [Peziza echinospora]|nr:hypothetical protein DFH27DRAFT_582449 [Peziza echinospora]